MEAIPRKYRIPLDDNLEPVEIRNMALWADEIVLKITREYKTGQPVLVHCAAGMQRSAASVAMFLIATRNMTPETAIQYIKERRPIAFRGGVNFEDAIDSFYDSFQRDIRPKITGFQL